MLEIVESTPTAHTPTQQSTPIATGTRLRVVPPSLFTSIICLQTTTLPSGITPISTAWCIITAMVITFIITHMPTINTRSMSSQYSQSQCRHNSRGSSPVEVVSWSHLSFCVWGVDLVAIVRMQRPAAFRQIAEEAPIIVKKLKKRLLRKLSSRR